MGTFTYTYVAIQGNEEADAGAKEALYLPLIYEATCFSKVITNIFRAQQNKALFNVTHYYENTEPAMYTLCNSELNIQHILIQCPMSRTNMTLRDILDCSVHCKIRTIQICLRKHNINKI